MKKIEEVQREMNDIGKSLKTCGFDVNREHAQAAVTKGKRSAPDSCKRKAKELLLKIYRECQAKIQQCEKTIGYLIFRDEGVHQGLRGVQGGDFGI